MKKNKENCLRRNLKKKLKKIKKTKNLTANCGSLIWRLKVKIFRFWRLTIDFLAIWRLTVNLIETLYSVRLELILKVRSWKEIYRLAIITSRKKSSRLFPGLWLLWEIISISGRKVTHCFSETTATTFKFRKNVGQSSETQGQIAGSWGNRSGQVYKNEGGPTICPWVPRMMLIELSQKNLRRVFMRGLLRWLASAVF